MGETLYVPMPDRTIEVEVRDTVFFDKEGGGSMAKSAQTAKVAQAVRGSNRSQAASAVAAGVALSPRWFLQAACPCGLDPAACTRPLSQKALGLDLPLAPKTSLPAMPRAGWRFGLVRTNG
jgi:hypothetical protein